MQDLVKHLHIDMFEEIIAVGALYRKFNCQSMNAGWNPYCNGIVCGNIDIYMSCVTLQADLMNCNYKDCVKNEAHCLGATCPPGVDIMELSNDQQEGPVYAWKHGPAVWAIRTWRLNSFSIHFWGRMHQF